jgi:hypothetical protein
LSDARSSPHRRGPGDRRRYIKQREPTAHWQLKDPAFLTRSRVPGLHFLVRTPVEAQCAPFENGPYLDAMTRSDRSKGMSSSDRPKSVRIVTAATVGPHVARAAPASPRPPSNSTLRHDSVRVALLPLLILPLARLDAAFDEDLAALGQVLAAISACLPNTTTRCHSVASCFWP